MAGVSRQFLGGQTILGEVELNAAISLAELEELIGFFVNAVVLRSDLSGDPSFRELLARVREVVLGALEHQDLPFEKLVEELQPERDLSRNPLFQVTFQLVGNPTGTRRDAQAVQMADQQITGVERGTSIFDIAFSLRDDPGEINGHIEYNVDLFEAATIERMVRHFQTLIAGIVANPDQPISHLPLLTTAERTQLLDTWNATNSDVPPGLVLHRLIEAQVERMLADDRAMALAENFAGQWLEIRNLDVIRPDPDRFDVWGPELRDAMRTVWLIVLTSRISMRPCVAS